jgi:hypothetical protein
MPYRETLKPAAGTARFRELFLRDADPAGTLTCAERAGPHRRAFGATAARPPLPRGDRR